MAEWVKAIGVMLAITVLSGCAVSAATQTREFMVSQIEADQAYARKDCKAAIPLYRELADNLVENSQVLLRLGNCLVREQHREEAMSAYREALLRDPSFVKAWYNLSYIQAQDLALTVADMSSNVDPADPAAERVRILTDKILAAFKEDRAQASKPTASMDNTGSNNSSTSKEFSGGMEEE